MYRIHDGQNPIQTPEERRILAQERRARSVAEACERLRVELEANNLMYISEKAARAEKLERQRLKKEARRRRGAKE